MRLSRFFIDRPIFAAVLSIVIFIAGLIAMLALPVSEYPEVVPPSVVVRAIYPGANPRVLAEAVATPLEEQINGVENMLYMSSQATVGRRAHADRDVPGRHRRRPGAGAGAEPGEPGPAPPAGGGPPARRHHGQELAQLHHGGAPRLAGPPVRRSSYLRNYGLLQVKDVLARIPGVGQVQVFGGGDYAMRVWLDPGKVAARGLTASDVVNAIREQNVQVAAGVVGAPPMPVPVDYQLSVNARGRLIDEKEFGDIILKTGADGEITRLRDVARIELAAGDYALRSLLDNQDAVGIGIFQAPGSNALQLSTTVRATMEELKKNFPEGVEYRIVYDPTINVRDGIREVVQDAVRGDPAGGVRRGAVPPDLAGLDHPAGGGADLDRRHVRDPARLRLLDQHAVAVRAGARHRHRGGRRDRRGGERRAQHRGRALAARRLVQGDGGGQRPDHRHRPGALRRVRAGRVPERPDRRVLPAVRPHDRVLDRDLGGQLADAEPGPERDPAQVPRGAARPAHPRCSTAAWAGSSGRSTGSSRAAPSATARRWPASSGGAASRWRCTPGWSRSRVFGFNKVPHGFVPTQDKQYLVAFAQLPDAATLDRTEKVIREMADIGRKQPGVENAVQFPGLSINGFVNAPNAGIVFFTLKPFDERHGKDGVRPEHRRGAERQVLRHPGRVRGRVPAAAGERPGPGRRLQAGARGPRRPRRGRAQRRHPGAARARRTRRPELAGLFSSYRINVPQLEVEVDREKVKQEGISLTDLFQTMQVYLGSVYANDFNRFGRTYQVKVQADAQYRATAENIAQLKVRNAQGAMVPLGSVVQVKESHGPDQGLRYNGYPAADINGGPAPGVQLGPGGGGHRAASRHEVLPNGIGYEWTDLSYQQRLSGNTAVFIFPLCVLLAFLVLAAQYESWSLPLAVILIVPMSLLCAITGVWLTKGDNNIFTQIGFLVLIGLACKNAILIVEFARELHMQGRSAGGGGARGLPHPAPADPHDLVRLHHGRAAAGVLERRRRRDAACDGRGGVLRHARRDVLRPGAHAGVLRRHPARGRAPPARDLLIPPSEPAHGRRSMRRPTGALDPDRLAPGRLRHLARRTGRPTCRCRRHSARPRATRPSPAAVPPPAVDGTDTALSDRRAAADPPSATGRPGGPGRLLARAGRHDARPPDGRAGPRQPRRARPPRRGCGARGAARTEAALDLAPTVTVGRRLHPAAALERDVPDRRAARFPTRTSGTRGFDASWELDLFGRVRRNVQAQGALVGAASEDLRDVQVSLTAELARTYFELRGAQERLGGGAAQRREPAAHARGDPAAARRRPGHRVRYRAGPRAARLHARVDSRARGAGGGVAVPDRRAGRPAARRRGRRAGATAAMPGAARPSVAVASPDSLIRRRPDVAAAERQVAAERAFVGAAKADYLPRITVGGSAGYSAGDARRPGRRRAPSATRSGRSSRGRRSTWAG